MNKNRIYKAPSTCGACGHTYTRASSLKQHYNTKSIKIKGKVLPNPCFRAEKPLAVHSSSEAKAIKTLHGDIYKFVSKRKALTEEILNSQSNINALPEEVINSNREVTVSSSNEIENVENKNTNENIDLDSSDVSVEGNDCNIIVKHEASAIDYNHNSDIMAKLNLIYQQNAIIMKQNETILRKIENPTMNKAKEVSQSKNHTNIDNKCNSVCIAENEKHAEMSVSKNNNKMDSDCYTSLRMAVSVEKVMNNRLIKDIFKIEKQHIICTKCNDRTSGVFVEDENYDKKDNNINQPVWFRNTKRSLERHLKSENHIKNIKYNIPAQTTLSQTKGDIMEAMRNLSYFSIKCELSLENFPYLLATVSRCKVQLGNINHSRDYITTYLECVNQVLINDTVTWLEKQEDDSVSVTLDIGTCQGVTLLAVLFIVGKEVRIANVLMAISKKGIFLADLCFEALKMGNCVSEDMLKKKVVGLVGDGAFIKGNRPFKDQLDMLFNKQLTYRWDLLHLVNRAHVPARGKSELEKEKFSPDKFEDDSDSFEDSENDLTENVDLKIPRTIAFIQSNAKKYRTGILFTGLLDITLGKFQRPKIWSSTRMVLYELDMLSRFLENKVFFEVPVDIEVTASIYMVVMFGLKIILKQAQKTDISADFVTKVFLDESYNYGEKVMNICLELGYQELSLGYHNEPCDLPDVLLSDYVEVKGAKDNKFYNELAKFLKKHKDNINIQNVQRETRNSPTISQLLLDVKLEVKNYITNLWIGIRSRLDEADTRQINATSFSEAPAEGVFSVWERVTAGKGSMTLAHANAMLRVNKEGPSAGSKTALQLSAEALKLFPSIFGERFTTVNWFHGATSKTVKNILVA